LPQGQGHLEDVNGDGLAGFVFRFLIQDTGIWWATVLFRLLMKLERHSDKGSDVVTTVGSKSVATSTQAHHFLRTQLRDRRYSRFL